MSKNSQGQIYTSLRKVFDLLLLLIAKDGEHNCNGGIKEVFYQSECEIGILPTCL